MSESVRNSTQPRRMSVLRCTMLVMGLLALALAAPAVAQPNDPVPKDRPRTKACIMSIFVIVRDGVKHRCWYRVDPKLGCVPQCDPPLSRRR
jgi:hypothetical protein